MDDFIYIIYHYEDSYPAFAVQERNKIEQEIKVYAKQFYPDEPMIFDWVADGAVLRINNDICFFVRRIPLRGKS